MHKLGDKITSRGGGWGAGFGVFAVSVGRGAGFGVFAVSVAAVLDAEEVKSGSCCFDQERLTRSLARRGARNGSRVVVAVDEG